MRSSSRSPWMLLAGAYALGIAGCDAGGGAGRGAAAPEADRYGGTAVVAGTTDLQSMNPLVTNETYARLFQRELLFLPLLRYDQRQEPVPWLAERWDTLRVARDTLELTFHLRRDVSWQDGVPLTATDVQFTYERVIDPRTGSSLAGTFARYHPRVTQVDPYTVTFRLRPHAEFLDGWAQLPIAPAHLLATVPAAELASHPFGTEGPVGSGPFRFVRRTPGQEWVFEANPEFPEGLGGRPYLDRLVYRVIPDPSTLLSETLTGTVHLYLAADPELAGRVAESPDVEVRSSPSPSWTFIAWNTRLPFFDTPEERRALTMALDRAALVHATRGGHADVGRSVVTPAHWSFARDDPEAALPHDVDAARRLLAAAEWADRDGDGILEDARGRAFRFTLKSSAANRALGDLVQIVQAQLRQVGIDVRATPVEGNALIGQISGQDEHGTRPRDFEAVVMGWNDGMRKDDSNLFHSRNREGPFQIASFANPRVDTLLDTLGVVVERERARPLWTEYQRIMAREVPFTVLFYPHRITLVRRELRGVEMDERGELASVPRWWIAPEERR